MNRKANGIMGLRNHPYTSASFPSASFGSENKSTPGTTTIDKSGANTAAIRSVNADACVDVELRQSKYLNNLVEQDHRGVKRITNPMLGFKSFWSAQKLIAGIETMHMVKKGQLRCPNGKPMSAATQFYSLAF